MNTLKGDHAVGSLPSDPEKASPKIETTTSSQDGQVFTTYEDRPPFYEERPGLMTRLGLTAESFKRRTLADEHNQLNKTLKARHLNMIAIGGSIGAGLFVGSGGALRTGGPAALLIAFGIIGVVRPRPNPRIRERPLTDSLYR
jgi:amino acid transporter